MAIVRKEWWLYVAVIDSVISYKEVYQKIGFLLGIDFHPIISARALRVSRSLR